VNVQRRPLRDLNPAFSCPIEMDCSMSLYDFIKADEHHVARERLLYTRAAYEMKLHGAQHGVQVQMTEPEIDNRGYDFTVVIGYEPLHLQNKATVSDTTVGRWDIHASLIQPRWHDRDLAPFNRGLPIGNYDGASGGVLLHEICAQAAKAGELKVRYFYFDQYYAAGVASGAVAAPGFSAKDAADLLDLLQNAVGRFQLPKRAFLPISSPAAILALRMQTPGPSNYMSLAGEGDVIGLWSHELEAWKPAA